MLQQQPASEATSLRFRFPLFINLTAPTQSRKHTYVLPSQLTVAVLFSLVRFATTFTCLYFRVSLVFVCQRRLRACVRVSFPVRTKSQHKETKNETRTNKKVDGGSCTLETYTYRYVSLAHVLDSLSLSCPGSSGGDYQRLCGHRQPSTVLRRGGKKGGCADAHTTTTAASATIT